MDNGYFKLTHYRPNGKLDDENISRVKHLKVFKFLITSLIEALEALYLDQHYQLFDPHVGDTLCQIRALHLLELTRRKNGSYKTYIRYLKRFLNDLELVIAKYADSKHQKYPRLMLKDFLIKENLILDLPDLYDFLLKTFLLTKFVKIKPDETKFTLTILTIDYELLVNSIEVTKKMVKKLVMHWQRTMTQYSMDYIHNISCSDMLTSSLTERDNLGRLVLPAYYAMDIILKRSKACQFKILLLIYNAQTNCRPLMVSFTYNQTEKRYQLEYKPSATEKYLFITCVSDRVFDDPKQNIPLVNDLKTYGISDILMHTAAKHVQFSCPELQKKQASEGLIIDAGKYADTRLDQLKQNYKRDKAIVNASLMIRKDLLPRAQHVSMGTFDSAIKLFKRYVMWYNNEYNFSGITERRLRLIPAAA